MIEKAENDPPGPTLPGRNDPNERFEGMGDETPEPKSFERNKSDSAMPRSKRTDYSNNEGEGVRKMHKFTLYETSTRFYLVGADLVNKRYKVLKIDRTAPPGELNLCEDNTVYSLNDINQLLNTLDDGNRGTGGMKLKCSTWGILGFVRFTEAYYMVLITKRKHVAMLGGHYIYQVDATQMIPLTTGPNSKFQQSRNADEARYLTIFGTLDLSRSFYFSYSYNVTRTLQHNIIRARTDPSYGRSATGTDLKNMFVWNHHLLNPAIQALKSPYELIHPIIHGFVDQKCVNVFNKIIYITLIARRSRYFAGARFLKRGANDLGYVANDVETEQIVSDMTTTSFHAPGPRLYANPNYTSYTQHRGSIPLYWTQDNSGVSPKPDIEINLVDPFYTPAALHFDDLFERYGSPVFVLNLIKAKERTPRESKLLTEFQNAINYLNQFLPPRKKIQYQAYDMSRASKTRGQDVIGTLESIAAKTLQATGFFHNGDSRHDSPQLQNGIVRTNCIDCLDRTNAAQFVVGKRALGLQLHALGVIGGDDVEFDTDTVDVLTQMYHDHGDTIAIQYGGSQLVNTMETYRKIKHWQTQSRDMVESFKRYYHNSFLDSQRQEAYNLFLGNYIFTQGQPMLWDLPTDHYLHHTDPKGWLKMKRPNYISWYTPDYLEKRIMPVGEIRRPPKTRNGTLDFDDFWLEYYRPVSVSSLLKVYAFNIESTARNAHERVNIATNSDLSPFASRKSNIDMDTPKKVTRRGVTILAPEKEGVGMMTDASGKLVFEPAGINRDSADPQGIPRLNIENEFELNAPASEISPKPVDKSLISQWTINQIYYSSLHPSVSAAERAEYEQYVRHPLNLSLVVSAAKPDDVELAEYAQSASAYSDGLGSDGVGDTWGGLEVNDHDLEDYRNFFLVADDSLTVSAEDGEKKRYKAYRKWLQGKSFFKQGKVDP